MLSPQRRRHYLFRLRPLRLALEVGRTDEARAEMEAWDDPLARAQAFHGTFRVDAALQRLLNQHGADRQHAEYGRLNLAAMDGHLDQLCELAAQHQFPECVWDSILNTALANAREEAAWWILPRAARLGGAQAVVNALHARPPTAAAEPRLSAQLITHLVDTLAPEERLQQLPDLLARAIRVDRLDLVPRLLRRWQRVAHRVAGRSLIEEMVLQEALIQKNGALAQRLMTFFKLDLNGWGARRHLDGIAPTPVEPMDGLEQWQHAVRRAQQALLQTPARPAKARPRC